MLARMSRMMLAISLVLILPIVATAGDELDNLLKELDKLEKQLETIGDKADQKAQAPAKAETAKPTAEPATATPRPVEVTAEDFMALLQDVEYLKAELALIRSALTKTETQLASLDAEGFYMPDDRQENVRKLNERLEQLNQVIGQMAPTAQNAPTIGHGKVKLSAYIQEHYNYTDGDNESNSFSTKRARLIIKGDINEYSNLFIQGDFAGSSPKLTDAVFTLSPNQYLSFSVGQTFPSATLDGASSPAAYTFANYSMLSGLEPGRDAGLEIKHRYDITGDVGYKLSAGIFNGAGMNKTDANTDKNITVRGELSLIDMFTFAPSLYVGKTNEVDTLKEDISNYAAALRWSWNNELAGVQYIQSEQGDISRTGWFMYYGHTFPINAKFLPAIQLAARYEQLDADTDLDGNRVDKLTVGTNLFIDENFTRIQLNYEMDAGGQQEIDNQIVANFQLAF